MKVRKQTLLVIAIVWQLSSCGNGDTTPMSSGQVQLAAAIPVSEVNNAAPDGPLDANEAFRLLEQATYGPTINDIAEASLLGPDAWINQQMQMPPTFLSDGLAVANSNQWNEFVNVWWRHAVQAEDQLRQRVAFALSQILVVSATAGLDDEQAGIANYYDVLVKHAFGNYRELLEDVTLNPVMGQYLSMKGNRKPDTAENIQPDENYARELLQLFSIGQVLLNKDGTPMLDAQGVPLPAYNQNTIENFARVFTGWNFANADDFRWPTTTDYISPMQSWEEYHDNGAKTLLDGHEVAAGLSAREDLNAALDNVFNHPNIGPFISRQLIQRLVTSNPSAQYVSDVANVFDMNHAGERGSLASTIKAILGHREARLGHLDNPDTYGKLKEPLLRVTQLWRAFEPETIPFEFNYGWVQHELGQSPLNSPSVFNFYRPTFSQPGEIRDSGLVSPEFQIMDETSVIKLTNRVLANTLWSHNFKNDGDGQRIAIDITTEMNLEPDRDALLDHLDLLLLGGRMSIELRYAINELMDARQFPNAASHRVVESIFLIASSPEAAIQR